MTHYIVHLWLRKEYIVINTTHDSTWGWEFGVTLVVGSTGGSKIQGDWEIYNAEEGHGHIVYCNVTYSGPLWAPARRPGARVSCRWWEQAGLDLRGREKGGIISGSSRTRRRADDKRGGVKTPRMTIGREWGRVYEVEKEHNRGVESSDLVAAVLGWNTITHYWACYRVTEAIPEEEK